MAETTVYDPATLVGLPYEIQQKIAMDLDIESTVNLCLGARALQARICKDDNLWQRLYERDFGPKKMSESLSWFENYKMKAGVLDFKYNDGDRSIEIYFGPRILGNFPYYEHYDDEPEEMVEQLEREGLIHIHNNINLIKKGEQYRLRVDCFTAGYGTETVTTLVLTKVEVIRLVRAMYSAVYEL